MAYTTDDDDCRCLNSDSFVGNSVSLDRKTEASAGNSIFVGRYYVSLGSQSGSSDGNTLRRAGDTCPSPENTCSSVEKTCSSHKNSCSSPEKANSALVQKRCCR